MLLELQPCITAMDERNDKKFSSEEKLIEPADNVYRVATFEKLYRKENNAKRSICSWTCFNTLNSGSICKFCKEACRNTFPFVQVLRNYKVKQDLPNDVISGITVGIMQIPQGMAYSLLASLPAICGLYVSLFAPLIYFFLGSSKHVSMGTIAVVSLMVASVLDRRFPSTSSSNVNFLSSSNVTENATNALPYENDDLVYQKIQVASALSFVSGLVLLVLGKLRLGLVANYMSEPMVCGFTSAVAIHVVTSQMKHILGIKVPRHNGAFKVIKTWISVFENIMSTNLATISTAVICGILLYLIKIHVNQRFSRYLKIPIPIELIVVILSTVTSHFGYFKEYYKVNVLGDIPAGIPKPQMPDPTLATDFLTDAVIIGLVAFTQSVSMAKIIARKNFCQINPNQEMVAYAAGSILCSIFSGYIPAASVARSLVQEGTGGRTQVAGLAGCIVVMVVVLAIGPLFYSLPECVLSAVIIINLRSMFHQFLELKPLWRKSKYDFAIWVLTFSCTVILDADIGIAIGVIFSLLSIAIRTQRASISTLGTVETVSVFKSTELYKVTSIPGVKVVQFESPLYFANADIFINKIQKITGIDPAKVRKKNRSLEIQIKKKEGKEVQESSPDQLVPENDPLTKCAATQSVVLDFSTVAFMDTVGVKALCQIFSEFGSTGIQVFVAGLNRQLSYGDEDIA